MNIIMENSNKQAPNFLTKKLINFGDAHKEQTDLYLANIKQDKFYKNANFENFWSLELDSKEIYKESPNAFGIGED